MVKLLLVAMFVAGGLITACATRPEKPAAAPPGYTNDVTPHSDGVDLIGGAP